MTLANTGHLMIVSIAVQILLYLDRRGGLQVLQSLVKHASLSLEPLDFFIVLASDLLQGTIVLCLQSFQKLNRLLILWSWRDDPRCRVGRKHLRKVIMVPLVACNGHISCCQKVQFISRRLLCILLCLGLLLSNNLSLLLGRELGLLLLMMLFVAGLFLLSRVLVRVHSWTHRHQPLGWLLGRWPCNRARHTWESTISTLLLRRHG